MSLSIGLLRFVFSSVTFLAGFYGVCWGIHEALPFPDVTLVKPKLDFLAAHANDYDTLFLGSSRIHYQIVPKAFDEATAAAGLATRSFNAGIAAMRPPEDAYYLDYLLRHPPAHLRWVFIELQSLQTVEYQSFLGTARAIYWHDWPRLRILFERALIPKSTAKHRTWQRQLDDRLEPLEDFFNHFVLFLRNETNFGGGTMLTARLTEGAVPHRKTVMPGLSMDQQGWSPTGLPEVMGGKQLGQFRKGIAERRADPARPDPCDPVSQQALEETIAKVEKLGARAVLVVPPTTSARNFYPSPERERKTPVLDFCDMDKFPELYDEKYRLDTDHLNAKGAEIFSRTLARVFLEQVQPSNPR